MTYWIVGITIFFSLALLIYMLFDDEKGKK